jgi:tetratricopeptide (TPR) repeat protein
VKNIKIKLADPLIFSPLVFWSVCCLAVFLVYAPGWHGPFVFDDQLNILENPNVPIHALTEQEIIRSTLSNESGPLKRIIPALSFGLNYYFADGFKSVHFKLFNIAIHCINSGLVFWLLTLLWPSISKTSWAKQSRLTNPRLTFAVSGTLIWALHAFLLTSVLYVVQRMTSMASMFMLMGACIYVVGRLSLEKQPFYSLCLMGLGLVGGTVLGVACKENAALLPVYIGALEFTLLAQLNSSKQTLKKVRWFFILFLGLPILAGLFYWFQHPGFITGGYDGRPFTFMERVLTEPRVLWFYLSMIIVPDIQTMGLFHDDFKLSPDLFTIWTTLPSIIGIIVLLVLSIVWRKRFPVFAFAVLWFLVGHSLESTVFPLEIIHEHRNYLPALGPLLSLTYLLLFALPGKMPNSLRISLMAIIIFCLGFGTFNRAQYWSSESALIESLAMNHPDSPSSQYLRGEILRKREKDFEGSYAYYLRAAELSPEEAGFLISLSMVTPESFTQLESKLDSLQLARATYIADIIHQKPMGAWGIRALDVAIKCVMSGNERCLSKADDVASWLQALIDKSKGKSAHRYYSLVHLFAIRMKQNRFSDALATAEAGLKLNPRNPRFGLMQAHALIGLKRLDKSEELLNDIQQSSAGRVRKYAQRITQLKQAIRIIRSKQPKSLAH